MTSSLSGLIFSVLIATSAVATAQQPPTPTANDKEAAAKRSNLVALVGCVSPNPNQPGGFVLSEADQLSQYKLTGSGLREFAGKRVQIYGEPPKRLKVVGGLYPTPNIAAEGGHDPVKAAMAAATPANTPGGVALPEFRVKSIQVVTGSCPDK